MLTDKTSRSVRQARLVAARLPAAQMNMFVSLPNDVSARAVGFLPVFDQLRFEECSRAAREVGRRAALQLAAFSASNSMSVTNALEWWDDSCVRALAERCRGLTSVDLNCLSFITDAAVLARTLPCSRWQSTAAAS